MVMGQSFAIKPHFCLPADRQDFKTDSKNSVLLPPPVVSGLWSISNIQQNMPIGSPHPLTPETGEPLPTDIEKFISYELSHALVSPLGDGRGGNPWRINKRPRYRPFSSKSCFTPTLSGCQYFKERPPDRCQVGYSRCREQCKDNQKLVNYNLFDFFRKGS